MGRRRSQLTDDELNNVRRRHMDALAFWLLAGFVIGLMILAYSLEGTVRDLADDYIVDPAFDWWKDLTRP